MRTVYFLLFLLTFGTPLSAARISGLVTNKSGAPIPYVLIHVDGTEIFSVTDQQGAYVLDLEAGAYTLIASTAEYQMQVHDILVDTADMQVDFTLEQESYTLDSVEVVAGEDLGVRIMRKVIANRKVQADKIKSLEAGVYLKALLKITEMPETIFGVELTVEDQQAIGLDENSQGIVYLLEQHTDYYYQQPNKTFNQIKSVRTAGDPRGLGFSEMPAIINIYENNVQILDGLNARGFISPANSNALQYYDFKFEGESDYKGKIINKIRVIPKREFGALFSGYVYVVEDEWVFRAVDLLLTRQAGMDLLDSLGFKQSFEPFGDDGPWVIRSQTLRPKLSVLGIGIGGDVITSYQLKNINHHIEDSIFKQKFVSVYEDDALDKKPDYWDSVRMVPLSSEEQRNYTIRDSVAHIAASKQAFEYNRLKYQISPAAWLSTGVSISQRGFKVGLPSLLETVQYNTIEGFSFTLFPKLTLADSLNHRKYELWAASRYGFSSGSFYYKVGASLYRAAATQPSRNWRVAVEGGRYLFDINRLEPIDPFINTFTSLYGYNYSKFYEAGFASAKFALSVGNGWAIDAGLRFEDRARLENQAFTVFSKEFESRITPNNPVEMPDFQDHKSFVYEVGLSYQPGWKYYKLPKVIEVEKGKAPTFSARFTQGLKNIAGSKSDFAKWNIGVSGTLGMRMAGFLKYQAHAGGFLKKNFVGNPDMMHIIGNRIWLAAPYLRSFQLAPYYALSHTQDFATELHLEWNLSGFVSNRIPLFKQLNYHFLLGTNSLYVRPDYHYTEAFFGIDNIGYRMVRFLRVDFVWGFSALQTAPNFGVRVGVNSALFNQ